MKLLRALMVALAMVPAMMQAQEDPAHAELRALRTQMVDAITKGDIDTVLQHVSPDVVVTWQNGQVCRGRDGLKKFFDEMGKKSFKGYKVPPTPDELTILYGGDTGVSFGETVAEYSLLGKEYEFKSRWTATLVKQDGKWILAAYHISLNALDNPLLNTAKSSLYAGAGGGLILGLVAGWTIFRRRKASAAKE